MLVEVTVENEGVRRRQRAARADQAIGWTLSLSELLKDCMLVAEPEDAVHLLTIDPGRKLTELRERPTAREVGIVAFIKFKAGDARINQLTAEMLREFEGVIKNVVDNAVEGLAGASVESIRSDRVTASERGAQSSPSAASARLSCA